MRRSASLPEAEAHLGVDQLLDSLPHVRDRRRSRVNITREDPPELGATVGVWLQLEVDASVGVHLPDRRPHNKVVFMCLEDLRLDLVAEQPEPLPMRVPMWLRQRLEHVLRRCRLRPTAVSKHLHETKGMCRLPMPKLSTMLLN